MTIVDNAGKALNRSSPIEVTQMTDKVAITRAITALSVPRWVAPVLFTVLKLMGQCANELCGRDAPGTDAAAMSVGGVLAPRSTCGSSD